jgi:hypothetical protein
MKKFTMILLFACLALVVSSSIFAFEGNIDPAASRDASTARESIMLDAYVNPYASLVFNHDQETLVLSGAPGQVSDTGTVTYTVETNCDLWADGYTTPFVGATYSGDKLRTEFNFFPPPQSNSAGWKDAPNTHQDALDAKYVKDGASVGTIQYRAYSGPRISSQRAGNYHAQVTVVLWHPQNMN